VNAVDLPIIGDTAKVPQDDPEFTRNWYSEKTADDVFTLKPTPGTVLEHQFSVSGGGRGLIVVAGREFGVRGSYFQEMVSGSAVPRGFLSSTTGKVGLAFNIKPDNAQAQIIIVDDSTGYVYDLDADTFTTLTAADNFVGGGSQVAYCSGRAVVFKPGTTFFQWSGLYEFTTWSDTANTSEQSLSSPILSVISNGDLLYFFSSDGFAVWQAQGSDTSPYAQILSGDKIGILAPNSALFCERYAYWLAATSTGDGIFYRHAGGGRPERISTHPIERNVAELESPEDAVSWSYQSLGHTFYVTTFLAGARTFSLDTGANLWAERSQRDPATGDQFPLPFISTAILDGRILALDYRNGKVWRIDDAVYTDDGNPITRDRILPVWPKEGDFLTYFQSAELFGQIGNTPVGQDDPQVMFRYSMDRGMTWSLEDWQQAGGDGTYAGRTRWVGLGAAYGIAPWFRLVASQFASWRMVRMRAE
jgi:hypothetical protein